ncbi:hypothetical protein EDD92_9728 [Streptomyces sp. TLI_185]|nr:hypothetical protein EDD92_9728 [Streptomyces sp. TLI_185]
MADPRPLPMDHLVARLRVLLRLPEVRQVPLEEHRSPVKSAMPELSDHQYALLTEDNWFDTGRIWRRTGLEPGPGFEDRFTACAARYARQLCPGLWQRAAEAHAPRDDRFQGWVVVAIPDRRGVACTLICLRRLTRRCAVATA